MPNNIAKYKRRIDEYLSRYLQKSGKTFKNINRWGSDVTTRLLQFVSNGKTIRGALVLLSSEAYGKAVSDDSLKLASALELIHSGLLIHDDIIDQDRMRRGHKTLYVQYEDMARDLKIHNRVSFGSGMATCIGDLTFFMATGLVSDIENKQLAATLTQTLAQEYASVCLAQMQDVRFGFSSEIPSEEEVLSVYRYKTARYTFSLPLIAGAMIAEAPEKELKILEQLGETVGILFQLHDDQLNLFGLSKQTGKPVGSDIREGKKTLAYLYVYNHATAQQRKKLDRIFGTTENSQDASAYIYQLLKNYRIDELINEKSAQLKAQSYDLLQSLHIGSEHINTLHDIIQYTANRQK